ncbi:MAG TPA: acetyl-CoA carboxylase, carboxyltransferase subunit beta [Terriglobales bacterium]|nr:acetyl-CoA carboxylase, carboxyltransferase subunit beta [Terriglobales bacterium]
MEWFKKPKNGLVSQQKKEIPDGLWTKCESCGEIIYVKELEKNLWVCHRCNFHFRIKSKDYIELLLDEGKLEEFDENLVSSDPLKFKDSKRYPDRIRDSRRKTGLNDAVIVGIGKIENKEVSFGVMDFGFIGGSMGSVVGEKVTRAIERSLERKIPLVIVSCSGGARMQEGILSLMQMAKTSALLAKLYDANIPFISVLTNPTTAGVMASYASLGDVIIAEPKALLGFAGPRVIQQTIKQELPPGFQSSEFFLEHGFLDKIVERKDLKKIVSLLLEYLLPSNKTS